MTNNHNRRRRRSSQQRERDECRNHEKIGECFVCGDIAISATSISPTALRDTTYGYDYLRIKEVSLSSFLILPLRSLSYCGPCTAAVLVYRTSSPVVCLFSVLRTGIIIK